MAHKRCFWLYLLILVFLAGCGGQNLFVLLPDPDGTVGQIAIANQFGEQLITEAGQAVKVTSAKKAPAKPFKIDSKKIAQIFGTALEAQPKVPERFLLYFESGTTKLKAESEKLLPEIIAAIKRRKSTDTSIVGHSDTVGSQELNYRLSKQRAIEVAKEIISKDVNAEILEITSHGEENPLVKTANEVPEPRNRRVEVTVR